MKETKQKLYAFVDESGQDTKGRIFIVSVLVLGKEKDFLSVVLEEKERTSGKKNVKWNKSRPALRKAYLEEILRLSQLKGKIFVEHFTDAKKYLELTSYSTAKAILRSAGENYKVTIFVDGLKGGELSVFTKGLRALRIRTKKVRGVKKDENNPYIRLVDAICGLARDADDEEAWAQDLLDRMLKEKIVAEL